MPAPSTRHIEPLLPYGVIRTLTPSVSGVATVSATLVRVRVRSASVAGAASVSCSVKRIRSRTAAVAGSASVSCSVKRVRSRTAAVSGSATVSCTLVRVRARSEAVNGVATVTASVVRVRALSATANGAATVTCVISNSKILTATVNGVATVSAFIPPQPIPPSGGTIFINPRIALRPARKRLRVPVAVVQVTAYAPQLLVTATPVLSSVQARTFMPAPTLTFAAGAYSTHALGELPESKRDAIDLILVADLSLTGTPTGSR